MLSGGAPSQLIAPPRHFFAKAEPWMARILQSASFLLFLNGSQISYATITSQLDCVGETHFRVSKDR